MKKNRNWSICSGSYTDGTWYNKDFRFRFMAVIAAKKRSAELAAKVYLHKINRNSSEKTVITVTTDSIYRDGKRDYETERNIREAEAYMASRT